ncbi:ADP-ribosylglycohydrolase family protein [Streptomyces venezuelae]|uniref:ADP-ribosylglycohydrolase family protein n=1 Tax=Streptomyces venezuelae TaxID=54571 RepID=UPI0037AA782E
MTRSTDLPDRSRGLLLGAAVGDALGWPQEQRSGIVGGRKARNVQPSMAFRAWSRWAGGQYAKYEDSVAAGEYSDDTQLLLATARACLRGADWLSWLKAVELPTWPLYQRGGGRAVLAACRSWQNASPPWLGPERKVHSYFAAGANGVAMRVSPHVIATVDDSEPRSLIARVLNDGILTHGHPRALLGGVIYALGVRHTIQQRGAAEYGDLLFNLSTSREWADPDVAVGVVPVDWLEQYEERSSASFYRSWQQTADEMQQLLNVAIEGLERSALADDEKTLGSLGCFDPKINGAGTITAAASFYLAARFSVRPSMGMLRSAFLANADTDTLASMTGALLGALHGPDWLFPLCKDLQDRSYIENLADRLANPDTHRSTLRKPEFPINTKAWLEELAPDEIQPRFPDGRLIQTANSGKIRESRNLTVTRYRLVTEDGQSLVVDRSSRNKETERAPSGPTESPATRHARSSAARVAIYVSNINRSLRFYRDVLDVEVHEADRAFYLSPWLAVLERPEGLAVPTDPSLQITVWSPDPERILAMVDKHGIHVAPRKTHDVQGSLRVLDPDGHEVLVWPSNEQRSERQH